MHGDGESLLFVGVGITVFVVVMFLSLLTMDDTGRDYTTIESTESWGAVE